MLAETDGSRVLASSARVIDANAYRRQSRFGSVQYVSISSQSCCWVLCARAAPNDMQAAAAAIAGAVARRERSNTGRLPESNQRTVLVPNVAARPANIQRR